MPYLNIVNFAPASLKSQETNFIQNHVNECLTAKTTEHLTRKKEVRGTIFVIPFILGNITIVQTLVERPALKVKIFTSREDKVCPFHILA